MGKTKLNIPMFAALILLLLTMVSTHFTSGLFARYTGSSTAADRARVARFAVTNTIKPVEDENGNIQPGKYTVTVENNSEVMVEYSIRVELDSHLSVTLNGETKQPAPGESFVTFTSADWKLAPETVAVPLTMEIALEDSVGITDPTTQYDTAETVTFKFKVHVTALQVD